MQSEPLTIANMTGRDISFGTTTLKSVGKSLFLQVSRTNPQLTKSGINVFDAEYKLPDNFNELVGSVDAVLVPSLTAFILGPSVNVDGRTVSVFSPNTNPGFIRRDEKGAIDFNTYTSVEQQQQQQQQSSTIKETFKSDLKIEQLFVYVAHPIEIVDDNGTILQTLEKSGLEKSGNDGRSTYCVSRVSELVTASGPLKVVSGKYYSECFNVPQSDTHDGVIISANLYAILKSMSDDDIAKVFGRRNFSLLLVDNDNMVKKDGKIVGTKNLLRVASIK